jgi:hypothetical protein
VLAVTFHVLYGGTVYTADIAAGLTGDEPGELDYCAHYRRKELNPLSNGLVRPTIGSLSPEEADLDRPIAPKAIASRHRSWWPPAAWAAEPIRAAIALSAAWMLAIGAGACSSSPAPAASSSAPAVVNSLSPLPSHLLGLSKNNSPSGQAFVRGVARTLMSGGSAFVRGVQTVLYGGSGPEFLVWSASFTSVGASNATAMGYAQNAKAMSSSVSKDAQSFPAGPHGGGLYCGDVNLLTSGTANECWWVDKETTGIVVYYGGFSPSLGDAASKTNQVRATIES